MSNSSWLRPRPVLTLLLVLVFFAPAASGAAQKPNLSACDGIFAWVDAHRNNLPRTYDEISTLHPAYRRAVYTTLSAEEKSELWRTQFDRQLATGSRLTAQQRGLLNEAREFSTPLTFSLLVDNQSVARAGLLAYLGDFDVRAKKAFGEERARAIFGMLGPASVEDMFFSAATAPGDPDSPSPTPDATACSCSRNASDCPKNYACSGSSACNRIVNGCGGVIWKSDCDGLCKEPTAVSDPPDSPSSGQ